MKRLYLGSLQVDELKRKGRLFDSIKSARQYLKANGWPEWAQVVRVYDGYHRSLFYGYSVTF